MSKRLIVILLFVSIAFNLAVLGSILWLHFGRNHPPKPPVQRFSRIPLPPNIEHMNWDPELRELRTRYDDTKIQLLRELAMDPIDENTIIAILDSSLTVQNSLERELGYRLLELRKQMSAEEAEAYFNARALQMEQRIQAIKDTFRRRRKHEEDNCN
jgi:hypothetical protein